MHDLLNRRRRWVTQPDQLAEPQCHERVGQEPDLLQVVTHQQPVPSSRCRRTASSTPDPVTPNAAVASSMVTRSATAAARQHPNRQWHKQQSDHESLDDAPARSRRSGAAGSRLRPGLNATAGSSGQTRRDGARRRCVGCFFCGAGIVRLRSVTSHPRLDSPGSRWPMTLPGRC